MVLDIRIYIESRFLPGTLNVFHKKKNYFSLDYIWPRFFKSSYIARIFLFQKISLNFIQILLCVILQKMIDCACQTL